MYKDEFGNIWASYEDYQTYLKEVAEDDNNNQHVVNELIGSYLNSSLDKSKDNKYIESGKNNE